MELGSNFRRVVGGREVLRPAPGCPGSEFTRGHKGQRTTDVNRAADLPYLLKILQQKSSLFTLGSQSPVGQQHVVVIYLEDSHLCYTSVENNGVLFTISFCQVSSLYSYRVIRILRTGLDHVAISALERSQIFLDLFKVYHVSLLDLFCCHQMQHLFEVDVRYMQEKCTFFSSQGFFTFIPECDLSFAL